VKLLTHDEALDQGFRINENAPGRPRAFKISPPVEIDVCTVFEERLLEMLKLAHDIVDAAPGVRAQNLTRQIDELIEERHDD